MADDWKKIFPDATQNLVEYLVDGIETFASYVKAIESAKTADHYIYILGWMLDISFPLTGTFNPKSGVKGQTFLNGDKTLFKLLEVAANSGVEIRILIWRNPLYTDKIKNSLEKLSKLPNTKIFIDSNTYTTERSKKTIASIEGLLRDLIKKVSPKLTHPAARIIEFYDKDPEQALDQITYYLDKKNIGSHHEKLLIVKGEEGLISFCGGIDINQNRFSSYHDTACRIKGPEAHHILLKFIKRWQHHDQAKSVTLKGVSDSKSVALDKAASGLLNGKVVGTYNAPDGKEKDRSAKEAYLKIIANARNYIYIEDQYLVNIDVANALNKKLKDISFKRLIIIIQDSRETTDILIPHKKRGEFNDAVIDGLSGEQLKKYFLFMINDDMAKSSRFHPGMHAKTLIVDDELAMIGSTNVNQRSFTLDSETSMIVFSNKGEYYRNNFAYKLRNKIWFEFIMPGVKSHRFGSDNNISWEELPRFVYKDERNSYLRSYVNNIQDMPIRIYEAMRPWSVPVAIVVTKIEPDITKTARYLAIVNSPVYLNALFEEIWESFIDPVVP